MEINKGIEPFDDRLDFTRNNPDRKPFGRSGMDQLDVRSEYDVAKPPAVDLPPLQVPPAPAPVTPPKFTHKLANGTVLEGVTVEELAAQIEKALVQAPAPVEENFEEKPVYEGYQFQRKELTLQEQANILNVWKENPQKANRMLQEAEFGATIDVVLQKLNESQMALRLQKEMEAGAEFLGECEDFNPTNANSKKVMDYLREQKKPVTVKNLKVAFHKLVAAGDKSLLIKVEEQPPAESAAATEELTEVPPPPVIVPSNQGRPETPPAGQVDVAKFAAMSLEQQKKFFADQRRRTQ